MADGAGTRPGSAKTQLGAGVRKAKDTGLVIPQSSAMEILPPEGGVAGLSGGTLSGALVHRSANTPASSQSRSRPSSAKSVSSVASVRPPSGSTRQTGKPRARTQGAGREADDRPDDRPAKAAFESTQHTAGIKPVPRASHTLVLVSAVDALCKPAGGWHKHARGAAAGSIPSGRAGLCRGAAEAPHRSCSCTAGRARTAAM